MRRKSKFRIQKTGAQISFNVQPSVRDAFEQEAARRGESGADLFRELVAPFMPENIQKRIKRAV
jgi:hypothetical protein